MTGKILVCTHELASLISWGCPVFQNQLIQWNPTNIYANNDMRGPDLIENVDSCMGALVGRKKMEKYCMDIIVTKKDDPNVILNRDWKKSHFSYGNTKYPWQSE